MSPTATRCTCGTLQGLLSAAAFRPWRGSQAEVAQGPGRDAAHQNASVSYGGSASRRSAGPLRGAGSATRRFAGSATRSFAGSATRSFAGSATRNPAYVLMGKPGHVRHS